MDDSLVSNPCAQFECLPGERCRLGSGTYQSSGISKQMLTLVVVML
jgi:hypothetical protein